MNKKFLSSILFILLGLFYTSSVNAENYARLDTNYKINKQSITDVVYDTIQSLGYPTEQISFALYDFIDDEHYYINSDTVMLGASTTKVGTAALFTQLITDGYLTYNTYIPYNDELYEEGGGEITNGLPQSAYTIEQLIFEMLYHSDNTAWNLLTHYYYQNIGDYHTDLLLMSGADITDPNLYQFNHVNAEILEGLLIEVASSPIYQPIIDIMQAEQDDWLLKSSINVQMAAKYGYLDTYFHDIGIKFDQLGQPLYAIVVMTDGLNMNMGDDANQLFGTLNLRAAHWFQVQHPSIEF